MTVAAVFCTCISEAQGMLISLKNVFKSKVKLFTRLHLKQVIDVYLDVIRIKQTLINTRELLIFFFFFFLTSYVLHVKVDLIFVHTPPLTFLRPRVCGLSLLVAVCQVLPLLAILLNPILQRPQGRLKFSKVLQDEVGWFERGQQTDGSNRE